MSEIKKADYALEQLQKFKEYFDDLYGQGLEIANWHLNGETENFDNFYTSALEAMTAESENNTKRNFRVTVRLDGFSLDYVFSYDSEHLKDMDDQSIVNYLADNIDIMIDVFETTKSKDGVYLGSF